MKRLAVAVCAIGMLSACGGDDPPAGSAGSPGAGASGGAGGSGGTTGSGGSGGSGDSGGTGASGGVLDGSSARGGGGSGGMSDGGGSDASDAGAPTSVTGPAGRSSDGVLTNHPEFQFVATGDVVITTAYFLPMNIANSSWLLMFGDIENRGQKTLCILLANLSIGGVDILTVVDGPAYDVSSSVTSECLPPGAKAAFNSIEQDVPAALLDTSKSLIYTFTGLELTPPASRHPDEPAVLQPRIASVTGGWGVTGKIQTRANAIRNFGIHVYARDTSGLLFDATNAYPGELGVLPLSTQMEFETFPVEHGVANSIDGPFAGFELYTSFIEGAATSALVESGRSIELGRRDAEVASARQRLYEQRVAAGR